MNFVIQYCIAINNTVIIFESFNFESKQILAHSILITKIKNLVIILESVNFKLTTIFSCSIKI